MLNDSVTLAKDDRQVGRTRERDGYPRGRVTRSSEIRCMTETRTCHGPHVLMQFLLPPHRTACTVRDRADRKANYNGMLCDAILLDSSLNLSVASVHAALALATAVEVLSHGFRAGFSVHLGIMISGASLHNVA